MKGAMCPNCRALHQAAGSSALVGLNNDDRYHVTHCKLCETPTGEFARGPDLPDVGPDEFGYPMAVVPWMQAATSEPSDDVALVPPGIKPRGPDRAMRDMLRKVEGQPAFDIKNIEEAVSVRLAGRRKKPGDEGST